MREAQIKLSENATLPEQVAQILLDDLRKAKPGDRILPERTLAEKYDVSRKTVREAISRLTKRSLLERRVGRGTFVSGDTDGNKNIPCSLMNFADCFPYESMENILSNINRNSEIISADHFHGDYRSIDIYIESIVRGQQSDKRQDIICLDEGSLPIFAEEGLISPIDDLLEKSKELNKSEFHPALLNAFSYNGKLYGIPQIYSNAVLFYNRELFDKFELDYPSESWTLENLVEAGKKLTIIDKETGKNLTFGLGTFQLSINTLLPFIYQHIPPEIKLNSINIFERQETAEALQFAYDLIYKDKICPFFQNALDVSTAQMFARGNLGMFIGQYQDYCSLKENCLFEWGVAELPRGKRRHTTIPTQGWAISAKSTAKAKAFKAIEKLMEPENSKVFCDALNRLPARNADNSFAIPDVLKKSLEYAIPANAGFPPNLQARKEFIKETFMVFNNFETPENLCKKLCEYSKQRESI